MVDFNPSKLVVPCNTLFKCNLGNLNLWANSLKKGQNPVRMECFVTYHSIDYETGSSFVLKTISHYTERNAIHHNYY